jgi:hypothetical protein
VKSRTLSSLAAVAMLAVATPSLADKTPVSGSATFKGEMIAVGVGYTWGSGILTYKGKEYLFKARGVSALGAGAEKVSGTAEVYHLNALQDFNGVYGAAGVGGVIGHEGGGTAVLKNDKGVEMRLHAEDKGLEINLALSGVKVTLMPK